MSDQQPEELRRDIERTRADMDQTLAQIEDRVSPFRIKDRQVDRFKERWDRTRTTVMGASDEGPRRGERFGQMDDQNRGRTSEMAERANQSVQQLTDGARQAPDRLEDATRGNPLAVGLIAFGIGALAGGLAPATKPERQLATGLRQQFEEPIRDELQHAGDEVKGELQEHAQQAVEETKQTAKGAADRTTAEAQERADSVRSNAEQAKDDVQKQRR
jgi:uncharacterized protein YjbJ (UPF0337 family)